MKKIIVLGLVFVAFVLVACDAVQKQTPIPSIPKTPLSGYDVHIAATKHAPTKPELFVHHFCKGLPTGVMQCQLYDSDKPDARLIGVEFIVPNDVWETFNIKEKPNWHGHVEELTKVQLQAPGMSEEEVAALKETLGKTHGKVVIFWDPIKEYPVTAPSVTII